MLRSLPPLPLECYFVDIGALCSVFLKPRQKGGGDVDRKGNCRPRLPVSSSCDLSLSPPSRPQLLGLEEWKGGKVFQADLSKLCRKSLERGPPPSTVLGIVTHTARACMVCGHPNGAPIRRSLSSRPSS